MARLSKVQREFEDDMNLVNRALKEFQGLAHYAEVDMAKAKESIQRKVESEGLTTEERETARLMSESVDYCQMLIGGWPAIGKFAGAVEQFAEPGRKQASLDEMRELETGLIDMLAWFGGFVDGTLSGRFQSPNEFFGWFETLGLPRGEIRSAVRNLKKNLGKLLPEVPKEKLEAQQGPSTGDWNSVKSYVALQVILTTYLKWVHRVAEEYSSVSGRRVPKAKKARVTKKWNPISADLRQRVPEFIGRIILEILIRAVPRLLALQ